MEKDIEKEFQESKKSLEEYEQNLDKLEDDLSEDKKEILAKKRMQYEMNYILKNIVKSLNKTNHTMELVNKDYCIDYYSIEFTIDNRYKARVHYSDNMTFSTEYVECFFMVEIALIKYFDKWANSGESKGFMNMTEVISLFEHPEKWVLLPYMELFENVVAKLGYNNNLESLDKLQECLIELDNEECNNN